MNKLVSSETLYSFGATLMYQAGYMNARIEETYQSLNDNPSLQKILTLREIESAIEGYKQAIACFELSSIDNHLPLCRGHIRELEIKRQYLLNRG